jgi:hypothetical protein
MNVELFGKTSRQIFPHLFLVRWRNFRKKKYRLYLKNKIKSVHDNKKKCCVLLVEETGVLGENHRPIASH